MIVLVDDERRENEGDLVCAAQHITPETVNFMMRFARGVLCVALEGESCDRLDLAPQSAVNTASLGTAFTVTVDAHRRFGTTTGVSAADRAATIRVLADPHAQPNDLMRPGHISPLRARNGGVLIRTGQTEGSVDLCRLAGLQPAAVIIEIMNDDGSMARQPDLDRLCAEHDLKMCSVADVIAHRLARETLIERITETTVQTDCGDFQLIAYGSPVDPMPHVALVRGRVGKQDIPDPVLVRMHSQNLLGDVFGDVTQPSGRILRSAMQQVRDADEGAIVYLRCASAGGSLVQQLNTPLTLPDVCIDEVQTNGTPTPIKMAHGIGSQILRDLGVRQLRLLTDHPAEYHALEGFGLTIVEHVPVAPAATDP
ncbi:MAG: 3,4-dihydroxy-2-butanone-4-phosphate synthase [Planctomycetaceae bacterium]|nr:3,4-dihydroxy-2-butanone-4-phosphate synthase [Planctomycetaceae bacterium]